MTNCKFFGNYAGSGGGGMDTYSNSYPALINCIFSGNSAYAYGGQGGGIDSGYAHSTVTNCTFIGNRAATGGARSRSS